MYQTEGGNTAASTATENTDRDIQSSRDVGTGAQNKEGIVSKIGYVWVLVHACMKHAERLPVVAIRETLRVKLQGKCLKMIIDMVLLSVLTVPKHLCKPFCSSIYRGQQYWTQYSDCRSGCGWRRRSCGNSVCIRQS